MITAPPTTSMPVPGPEFRIPTRTKVYLEPAPLPADLPAPARTQRSAPWSGPFLNYLGTSSAGTLNYDGGRVRFAGRDLDAAISAARNMATRGWAEFHDVRSHVTAVLQSRSGALFVAPAIGYEWHDEPFSLGTLEGGSYRSAREQLVALVGPKQWVDFRVPAPS